MRHNDARKWLHAVLDLLPVILIPVFMIYSHRHTIDSNTLVVQEDKVVQFNQLLEADETQYWVNLETYSISIDNTLTGYLDVTETLQFNGNHKYYYYLKSSYIGWRTSAQNLLPYVNSVSIFNGYYAIITGSDSGKLNITFNNDYVREGTTTFNFNLVDLTYTFGQGNEPTAQEFYDYTNGNFYNYTESQQLVIENYVTTTYNDSDIMSQFFYCLYNSVDKYFNMGNIFGMNNVYSWFEVNIFGGTASPSIFIVWNIVLYEFVMDLLFLLYGLFMWFIDMCKKLMEKPLNSIK